MLVILTEEQSMKIFLETLIARYYPKLNCKIIPHRGKQDLEKHIPKILRSWNVPNSRFIIVHDQDSWDCVILKSELKAKCGAVRSDVVVRIACMELEAWYWGDLLAVELAFARTGLRALSQKSRYRIPDGIVNPKDELKKHLPRYEQIAGAKLIAEHADIERNTSHSFRVFIKSLQQSVL
ncbi:MAG: DUF4276 family protein [Oscillospiraceae bacterium]|nr:DUF4276 family protein [Oscillospiraceae bacterium]